MQLLKIKNFLFAVLIGVSLAASNAMDGGNNERANPPKTRTTVQQLLSIVNWFFGDSSSNHQTNAGGTTSARGYLALMNTHADSSSTTSNQVPALVNGDILNGDVLRHMFFNLDIESIQSAHVVCKSWNSTLNDVAGWGPFFKDQPYLFFLSMPALETFIANSDVKGLSSAFCSTFKFHTDHMKIVIDGPDPNMDASAIEDAYNLKKTSIHQRVNLLFKPLSQLPTTPTTRTLAAINTEIGIKNHFIRGKIACIMSDCFDLTFGFKEFKEICLRVTRDCCSILIDANIASGNSITNFQLSTKNIEGMIKFYDEISSSIFLGPLLGIYDDKQQSSGFKKHKTQIPLWFSELRKFFPVDKSAPSPEVALERLWEIIQSGEITEANVIPLIQLVDLSHLPVYDKMNIKNPHSILLRILEQRQFFVATAFLNHFQAVFVNGSPEDMAYKMEVLMEKSTDLAGKGGNATDAAVFIQTLLALAMNTPSTISPLLLSSSINGFSKLGKQNIATKVLSIREEPFIGHAITNAFAKKGIGYIKELTQLLEQLKPLKDIEFAKILCWELKSNPEAFVKLESPIKGLYEHWGYAYLL